MPNNFSTLKLEHELEKFTLVRMNPAKYITSDLSLDSGTTYKMTFPYIPVNRVTVDGTEYTLVSGAPSSGEFSFNDDTKELKINLGVALGSQVIIAFYYLFFTSGRNRVVYQDPDNSATTQRDWEPNIISEPEFTESIENSLEGVVSVSSSSVSIATENFDLHAHLGNDYSFYNKKISVWFCINNIENLVKVYEGKIVDVSVRDDQISFEFEDSFGQLLDTASMGDTDIYFTKEAFPNVREDDAGKPIPFIFGKVSQYNSIASGNQLESGLVASDVNPNSLLRGVNISYDPDQNTSNNRTWGLCRVSSDGFRDFTQTITYAEHPEGTKQETNIFIPDGSKGDELNGKYFSINDVDGSVGFWFDVNNNDTIPVASAILERNGQYFRDYTSALKDTTADDVNLLPEIYGLNDAFYFGSIVKFGTLSLNIGSLQNKEITDVTCLADDQNSLSGKYFKLWSGGDVTDYYVWFDVDNASTDPAPAGLDPIEVNISENDDAITVATALRTAVDGEVDFSATRTGSTVTITAAASGATTDTVDVDTGFSIVTTSQGGTTGDHTLAWEYWNGSAWTSLSVTDNTNDFKTTGTNTVTYTVPSGWTPLGIEGQINSDAFYYLRARVATGTNFASSPLGTSATLTGLNSPTEVSFARRGVEVTTLLTADTLSGTASKLATAINADSNFSASASDQNVLVTNANDGRRLNGNAGDSGFEIKIKKKGFAYSILTVPDASEFNIGDSFVVAASPDVYTTVLGTNYQQNKIYVVKNTNIGSGQVIEGNNCPCVALQANLKGEEQNTIVYPVYERDYTATVTVTDGGNRYLEIDFTNNFEKNLGIDGSVGALDVFYRVKPDQTNGSHAKILKTILEKAGITTNAASFTQADTDLVSNANFCIPYLGQGETQNYLNYAELILKSTFGYVFLNNAYEAEYHIISAPTGTETITEDDIVEGSFSIDIQYQDIAYKVVASNPHYDDDEVNQIASNKPTISSSQSKTRYLHETESTAVAEHVLETFNSAITKILSYRGERSAKFIFSTVSRNLENRVGDNMTLERDGIIGNYSTKELFILSLNKSATDVKIIGTDLLGV